ncbi:MAG: thiamine pyrophosphate-dependent enzyme, partial [Actinomycetota bacterium]
ALASDRAWAPAHTPEVVLQLGAAPTTRATRTFVASADRLVVADRWHLDPDVERVSSWRLAVDPDAMGRAIGERRLLPAPAEWTEAWRHADGRARDALDGFLDATDEPFEPRIARDVAALAPSGSTLFVGNSTPIRDLDLAMAPREELRIMASRGASGIDGLVSTALGVAAGAQGPVVALLGDLTFLYDLGSVAWNAERGIDCSIVVVRNGGGEIFSLLPHLDEPEHHDLFVTPHRADLGALARAAGAGHVQVDRAAGVATALARAAEATGLTVIEVVVDPDRTLGLRDDLRRTVADALR